MGFAFTIVSILQMKVDAGYNPSVLWQVFACFVLTASEILVSITCLEFAYTQAPKSMKSVVMALFLLTVSLGNYFASAVKFLIEDESGNSLLPGASEFWFWTILVFATAFVFKFASKYYKMREDFQGQTN